MYKFCGICSKGNIEEIKEFISNITSNKFESAFSIACNHAEFETVQLIYSMMNYPKITDDTLSTLFAGRCCFKKYDFAQWLASISQTNCNDIDILNICINLDIDPESILRNFTTTDPRIQTKILEYIFVNSYSNEVYDILPKLIDADNIPGILFALKIKHHKYDKYLNVLIYACSKNKLDIAKMIIQHTDCFNKLQDKICESTNTELFDLYVLLGMDINLNRYKLLKHIFNHENIVLIRHLIKNNVDVHIDNGYGFKTACNIGFVDMAKLLYATGKYKNINKNSIFKFACRNGNAEIAQWLVELGVDIHVGDDYGTRISIVNGWDYIADWLIGLGADIHALDNWVFRKAICLIHKYHYPKILHDIDDSLIIKYIHHAHLNTLEILFGYHDAYLLHYIFCEKGKLTDTTFEYIEDVEICVRMFVYHNRIDCLELTEKYFPYLSYIVEDDIVIDYSLRPLPKSARFQ